jgi:hypothetical protein
MTLEKLLIAPIELFLSKKKPPAVGKANVLQTASYELL